MSRLMIFLREIVAYPAQMGAIMPSSKQLANRFAKCVPADTRGIILELGAGTGAITEVLLQQTYASQVVAIESSAKLTQHLQRRLPQLRVHQGDAQEASHLLKDYTTPVRVIISGLPLRSLPPAVVKRISQEIEKILPPGGLFIQFTYSLWGNTHMRLLSPSLRPISYHRVWLNLPPARVIVYQKSE